MSVLRLLLVSVVLSTVLKFDHVIAQCAGACQDTSNPCPNAYIPNECAGPSNIECCPEPTPSCNGQCQDNSLPCSGSYQSNMCPGPSNVQCCTSGGGGGQGLDVSVPIDQTTASCLASSGYSWAVVRGWHSYGSFDDNAPASLSALKSAGINADVYLFPCAGADPSNQVTGMISTLQSDGAPFGTVWLDIESNPSTGCGWSSDSGANCQFITTMISAGQGAGATMGVYSSASQWSDLMGGDSCTAGSSLQIWYARYSGATDCSDFQAFGGWTSPTWHQYSDAGSACGVGFDINVACSGDRNSTRPTAGRGQFNATRWSKS